MNEKDRKIIIMDVVEILKILPDKILEDVYSIIKEIGDKIKDLKGKGA